MKLQSMTDYVLAEKLMLNIKGYEKDFISKTFNYANFLKQPLTLGMFIPTDENGNVLKQPLAGMSGYDHIYKRYSEAKDRVIFEGFEKYSPKLLCEMLDTIEEMTKLDITITETAVKKYGL